MTAVAVQVLRWANGGKRELWGRAGKRALTVGSGCLLGASLWAAPPSAPPTAGAADDDWPLWRGPRGDNRPALKSFPQDLSTGLRELWRVTNLCSGDNAEAWSQPVMRGDKLVVTGRRGNKDVVVCLEPATGKPVWEQEYDAADKKVQYGDGPRATPTIAGDRVYTYGCMGHLACWNLADGAQVWMRKVSEFGGKRPIWGHSATPLLRGDRLLVMPGGKSLVVALDAKTGKEVWHSPPGEAGYAALTTVTLGGREQLLAFAGNALVALDPQTGQKRWQTPWATYADMNCCTPLPLDGKILLCSSEMNGAGGICLLNVADGGAKAVWENHEAGPGHNEPVIYGGHLYAYVGYSMQPKGFVCVDLADGKVKWTTDKLGGPGTVLQVGNQLLCLSNRGKLALVNPSPDGPDKVSERQVIKGFPVWTQPVIAQGRLYIRFSKELICYDVVK